jgi:hypothetical protein
MLWDRYFGRQDRVERALSRLRAQLAQEPATGSRDGTVDDDLRLFPIVEGDVCYPVAALLARGKLDEAARLVPERAWVASTPLYG